MLSWHFSIEHYIRLLSRSFPVVQDIRNSSSNNNNNNNIAQEDEPTLEGYKTKIFFENNEGKKNEKMKKRKKERKKEK